MDDKLLRLARKMKTIEDELNKITQIKDLEGLLFVNTEITNKYKKSINDVVNTYKDYVSKTQKELTESMNILNKESKEKTIKDKKSIDNINDRVDKIKEDIKNICVSIDKSIEDIQKDILKDIRSKNSEILSNLQVKDKELSQIRKENEILNDSLVNLKDMFNKLELQKGDNGKSAYEIACELGFKGSKEEWIKSLHGKDGKDIELRGMRSFSDAPKDNKIYGRKNKKWVEVTGGGGGGSSDYPDLNNKPSINNVELVGNKSLNDLGIQPKGNYALESDIPDVSNFITTSVNNLLNYYLKSETYTKQEVNNLIGQIATLQFQVVNELPQTGDSKYIYLVPSANPKTKNVKDEYIWTNNAWEQIGSTQVDLTGYATESWVNTQISGFLTQTQIQTLITIALTGYAKTEDLPTKTSDLTNDSGFITGYTETDPVFSASASAGITSTDINNWNNKSDFSGDYNDLTNKPTIPSEVTESTVSEWGFTKNTGTYSKPSGGIPKTDLTSAVQSSLDKADTALQSHQDISGKENSSNKSNSYTVSSTTTYASTKALVDGLETKQDTISDLSTIRSGASLGATALQSITSNDVTTALGYTPYNSTNPNGYTSNTGTITGITMNGSSKGTSGVVNLGTVITSHQDISGKLDTSKVKNASSTTAGDVYDVRYINTMIGNIESLLSEV